MFKLQTGLGSLIGTIGGNILSEIFIWRDKALKK